MSTTHFRDPDTLDCPMVIIRADSSCLFSRVPRDRDVTGKGRSDASCWFSANTAGCFRKVSVNGKLSRQKYSPAADSEPAFNVTAHAGSSLIALILRIVTRVRQYARTCDIIRSWTCRAASRDSRLRNSNRSGDSSPVQEGESGFTAALIRRIR